jgi:EpsG family
MISHRAARPLRAAWSTGAWSVDRVFAACFSLVYGTFLSLLPIDAFQDRSNYLTYAENSFAILRGFWEIGPLTAMVNEPLWLLLNHVLSLTMPPEDVVRIVILAGATSVAWLTLTRGRCHPLWLIVLLFLPQVIKNHIVHLRQGVAIAVFLAGWFSTRRPLRLACFALTPFIHVSFFIVLLMLALSHVFDSTRARVWMRALVGSATCVGVTGAVFSLAVLVGARQVEEYDFIAKDISGLGFILWSAVLLLMVAQGRRFIVQHTFALLSLGLYLSMYFVAEFSARVFENAMLVVLIAAARASDWRRLGLQAIVVVLIVYQYLTQWHQPAFGFGF